MAISDLLFGLKIESALFKIGSNLTSERLWIDANVLH